MTRKIELCRGPLCPPHGMAWSQEHCPPHGMAWSEEHCPPHGMAWSEKHGPPHGRAEIKWLSIKEFSS